MISHIVFDVDGTLTDGGIYISSDGTEIKRFQAKDGQIMRVLPTIGFTTIIITGRQSNLTEIRAKDLYVSRLIQGIADKKPVLEDYIKENGLTGESFAYIGDDLNDYAAMKLCAFKACPADATMEIKAIADYVSPFSGGNGAVRDICEQLLRESGRYQDFLGLFGANPQIAECIR